MYNNACANTGLSIALPENFTATDTKIYLAAAFAFIPLSVFTVAANGVIITSLLLSHFKSHGDVSVVNASTVRSLIVSMAVSDAIIGCFSMPLAIYELFMYGHWALGQNLCHIKQTFDVFLCTVSIYHVTCMAVDRYLAVCKPLTYRTLTINTVYSMIGVSWCMPAALSVVLFLGDWHTEGFQDIVTCFQVNSYCSIVFNMPFQVTLAMISFYIPMVTICVLYFLIGRKIWLVSQTFSGKTFRKSFLDLRRNFYSLSNKRRQREASTNSLNEINGKLSGKEAENPINNTTTHVMSTSSLNRHKTIFSEKSRSTEPDLCEQQQQQQADIHGEGGDTSPHSQRPKSEMKFSSKYPAQELGMKTSSSCGCTHNTNDKKARRLIQPQEQAASSPQGKHHKTKRCKGGLGNMKTVRTIGSVVLCFTFCWMPFSVYIVIQSYYMYALPLWPYVVLTWLGYFNSALNPILYCGNKSIRQTVRSFICTLNKHDRYI